MDKQQFDHIDNRIRQASEEFNVPFNEAAWNKMEVKLDEEFSKKRRRAVIWWWFSPILIGIAALGTYFYTDSFKQPNPKSASVAPAQVNRSEKKSEQPAGNFSVNRNGDSEEPGKDSSETEIAKQQTQATTPGKSLSSSQPSNKQELQVPGVTETRRSAQNTPRRNFDLASVAQTPDGKPSVNTRAEDLVQSPGNRSGKTTKATNRNPVGTRTVPGGKPVPSNSNSTDENKEQPTDLADEKKVTPIPGSTENHSSKADSAQAVSTPKASKIGKQASQDSATAPLTALQKAPPVKLSNSSPKGVYFLGSIAGEATGIKHISISNTKPVYGLGLGYRFGKRLSVQSGFFFGKKIYTAGEGDYKVKPGSYIAKVLSAEAECYIYDIPLTLRYDVLPKAASNLYVTSGLSSYILKRETYDMHFLNPSGAYRHVPYTYKNNIAYASVLNFSVGYERKITRNLFIQGEPYIKVPLAGLGEGTVKLYSIGMQAGIKYQPVKRKK